MKAHFLLVQVIRKSVGKSGLGTRLNEVLLNFVLHQGQFSNGIGDGLPSSPLYVIVFARAESWSLSPLAPMRFGVAALPTQSPISNGHSPSLSASCCRSSSRAQISVAARPSWSSVRSRNV